MPRWLPYEQGSDAWLKSRIGVLTASRMADAIAFTAKGAEAEVRRKLKIELLAERMTDLATERHVNAAMQWGIDNESLAKSRYEELTGTFIQNCGIAYHDTIEFFGASPDGLVDDGLIEIKCPMTTTHLKYKIDGVVPEQYKPQMLVQMAVTQRKWCDFMSFDPRVPRPHDAFIVRYIPAPEEIADIEEKAIIFLAEVDAMFDKLVHNIC